MQFVIILACVVIVVAICEYLILPRINKWRFKRWMQEHKQGNFGKPASVFISNLLITVDERCITIANVKDSTIPVISRTWSEILRVTGYKRDLGTADLICIQLTFKEQATIDLDEDMAGWPRLVEELPNYLPGCRPHAEWYQEVAFPAFATNITTIYVRKTDTTLADPIPSPNTHFKA